MYCRVRVLISVIICALLSGCSYHLPAIAPQEPKVIQKTADSNEFKAWDKEFEVWNKQQAIQLLPHQKYPIYYLESHSEQPGLVINHELGTGKTLLAIGFAERYPDRPVIILAPKFLLSHWLEHLDKYQVKNKARYRFVGHDACTSLVNEELSDVILILDESHRFIERVRKQVPLYSQLYMHLRKCHKILSLSGTPIYTDIFDLVYQTNFVAGKEVFPFNQSEFLKKYTTVNTWTAYWRGHLMESNYFPRSIWTALGAVATAALLKDMKIGAMLGFYASLFQPIISESFFPWFQYPLKSFEPNRIVGIVDSYFSYYSFNQDAHWYPKRLFFSKEMRYSSAQLKFLYKLYDNQLNATEVTQLLKDSTGAITSTASNCNALLNHSALQQDYSHSIGAGREIGNLIFQEPGKNGQAKIMYSQKFEKILKTIQQSNGPVMVYSHYYYNGLLLLKQFLDDRGYQGQYEIFHPEMSKEQHAQIIHKFNSRQIKILLMHPDVTEGISLKGTRQVHFLEVPVNIALQRQIIGRAIRYRSHMHLPENERWVQIYIWQHIIGTWDLQASKLHRRNWHENFAELNYYSLFAMQLDPNTLLKRFSPDTRAYSFLHTLDRQMEDFKMYLQRFSIENSNHAQPVKR